MIQLPFILVTNDTWRSQLYRWRRNLPRVGGCHLHRDYRGLSISFLLQFSPKEMKLNKEQFAQFVENYVSQIVEGLDVESLESMVTELLIREYETYTEEQIVGEITEIYDEEFATELLESVTDVPV